MASPQLENGYLRLSNELAEAICRTPFNGSQARIVMAIIRETYGNFKGRKSARLSLRRISETMGTDIRNVQREVVRLLATNVITRAGQGGEFFYGVQKDYDKWSVPKRNGQEGDGEFANGESAKGETASSPMEETASSPTHIKKQETKKNISSKPDGSDGSVCGNGTQKKAVERVWQYYIQKTGKNPKVMTLTESRKQKGLARLKECLKKTDGNLERAATLMEGCVDALVASDFHMGANDQKKRYDSWEKHLFPNQDKMESWLEKAVSQ